MKELQTVSVVAPGFFGLNTQESGVTLSPNFAAETDNVVIDKYGRLGARKGWTMQTTDGDTELSDQYIEFMLEHVNADNSKTVLSAGNNKVFTGGVGASLTDITPSLYTISGNRWKGASLNDHALLVQEGQEPLVYTESASPVCQTLSDYRSAFTPLFGTSYPIDVIAAYGRFWTHDGSTIYWSTDIADTAFPAFYGGSSGTLNISSVLPNNTDTIVALASHNDFLIIFCENNIVIYSGAINPIGTAFQLSDVISGVGCTVRDSVQTTGNDLLFLSDTGIRSLGRGVQEKSLPMRDLTKNVRDDLLNDIRLEKASIGNLNNLCSVYSELNAFYLLSIPSLSIVYCLDMRQPLEDGATRVTKWSKYKVTSLLRIQNRDILLGKSNGIGKYEGYKDNNVKYSLSYYSHYIDIGLPTTLKMLKQLAVVVIGGSGQDFVIKTNFDYLNATTSYRYTIEQSNIAEYNVGEFGIAEFSIGIAIDSIKASVGGSGNTVQIGFEADVFGSALSVQKIDMFVKTGRTS